jgi:hypothetical protein
MKRLTLNILLIFLSTIIFGQEIISDLSVNPVVKKNYKKFYQQSRIKGTVVNSLPFIDDFSIPNIYPDDSLWQDRMTFVNSNYPFQAYSIGVATFDALNDTGSVYSNAGPLSFPADTLTSQVIRMDSIFGSSPASLSPADSIYLSFLYQPQGIGNAPETSDSLVLEFYSSGDDSWFWQWSTIGMKLTDFYDSNGVYFKQVLIPVVDSMYFNDNFQFRFRNYASIPNSSIPSWGSNADQWHLDYVYIDINRTMNDTAILDFALKHHASSLLKNYYQMPWNQYKANPSGEMADTFALAYRNLSNTIKSVDQVFRITDLTGTTSPYNTTPTPITQPNVCPFCEFTFTHNHSYNYQSTATPYADFEVFFDISTGLELNYQNNSTIFYQKFYNYYAYDDGTPEAGYGLSPAGARLAYQFNLNTPDTLQSIQMFFNQILNPTTKYFYLTVWDDNNGVPGNVIYEKSGTVPVYENTLNEYHTYVLDNPVPVSGTFYIGWRQNSNDNLNIGLDLNRNAREHIFYNTSGSWANSQYKAALMIRPILGSSVNPHIGMGENKEEKPELTLYPNPNSGSNLFLKSSNIDIQNSTIEIYNTTGQLVTSIDYSENINISDFSVGLYILRLIDQTKNQVITKQFIIQR